MNVLIGSTGTIGTNLRKNISFDRLVNSVDLSLPKSCDTVVCAAPSGNRFLINQDPNWDLDNLHNLIKKLNQIKCNRIVLISTVDVLHSPESPYGKNRIYFENFIKNKFSTHHIIRLCTLIGPEIKKNLLYDVKHQNTQYIDDVSGNNMCQWYWLDQLSTDIDITIKNNINEINLVSEPISNQELFENVDFKNTTIAKPYNIVCNYPKLYRGTGQYVFTKQQIKTYVTEYLNDTHIQ